MTQTFHPVTPVECSPGTSGSYQDVDLDTYIADLGADVTGVVLHYQDNNASNAYAFHVRKNGSTDNRPNNIGQSTHGWAMVGVDSSHIFECYIGHTTRVDVFIVGYTTTGVTFLTNGVSKTPGSGTWNDEDCSAQAPSAIGLIFEVSAGAGSSATGLRKNGSTDNRYGSSVGNEQMGFIVGCDAGQICEAYYGSTYYLIGYVTDGVVLNTNATDVSLGSTAAYYDLTALGSGACMGFYEIVGGGSVAMRVNGSSEDIYRTYQHGQAFVQCDASFIVEGKIGSTNYDFFLTGYATTISTYEQTLTDGLNLGDSTTGSLSIFQTLTDGLTLGDSTLIFRAFYEALTDGLILGDIAIHTYQTNPSLTDGLTLGDLASNIANLFNSLTDGLSLGDSTSPVGVIDISVTDGLILGDTAISHAHIIFLSPSYAPDTRLANRIYVIGTDANGNMVFGEASAVVNKQKLKFYPETIITNQADAAAIAANLLSYIRLATPRGNIRVVPNVGTELWDVISITDSTDNQTPAITRRVSGWTTTYDSRNGTYEQTIKFTNV